MDLTTTRKQLLAGAKQIFLACEQIFDTRARRLPAIIIAFFF